MPWDVLELTSLVILGMIEPWPECQPEQSWAWCLGVFFQIRSLLAPFGHLVGPLWPSWGTCGIPLGCLGLPCGVFWVLLKIWRHFLSKCVIFLMLLFKIKPPLMLWVRWCQQCMGATGAASVWQSGVRNCRVDPTSTVNYRMSGGQKCGQWELEIETGVNHRISGGQKCGHWAPAMETGINYRISGGQKCGQWVPEIKTGVHYRISGGQKCGHWEPEIKTGLNYS